MKKLQLILALAIAFTMSTAAQIVPQGKMLPFNGVQKTKLLKSNRLAAPLRADGDVLVTPPETATIETNWVLTGTYINNNGNYYNPNAIEVAFDGSDVYIKGLYVTCPDAWMKGTINGTTATFELGQYMGTYGNYSIYSAGSTDGSTLDNITFEYNESEGVFTLQNYMMENTNTTSFAFFLYTYDVVITKVIPVPTSVLAEPAATSAAVAWTENGNATAWNVRYRMMPEACNLLWDFEDENQLNDWMSIDYDGDDFGWMPVTSGFRTHSGKGVLVSASYDNDSAKALTPDDWLISPSVTLGGKVSFWACGQDSTYCNEVFAVYVAPVDTIKSFDDFIKISDDITTGVDMTEYTFDLSAYQGTGYIAVRHYNVTDQFVLVLDDFTVEVPNGEWPGEWSTIENVTENPYTIDGLTPETDYQVQVQAVADNGKPSEWSAATSFTTLAATPDVYILGEVNDQAWAPNAGLKMTYNEEDNIYTATVTLDGRNSDYNYFSFTTEIAENNDQGGWDYIAPYRFGAVSDGDFEVFDEYLGQPLSLTYEGGQAFKLKKGEYNLTVDLASMKLIIEKIGGPLLGDANDDGFVTISDVTTMTDYLLSGSATPWNAVNADVNQDGEVTIGDVTALIDMLLAGN